FVAGPEKVGIKNLNSSVKESEWKIGMENFAYSTGPLLDQPASTNGQMVALIIPGLTLPIYAIGYYISSFLISGVFHELGHAVAAISENIPIQSAGLFVLGGIYPGAYVQFDESSINILNPFRKLRIICAGVWHNIVLAVISYLLLWSLPLWISFGYTNFCYPYKDQNEVFNDQGLVILEVRDGSPLLNHLEPHTFITQIDDNAIHDFSNGGAIRSWENALQKNFDSAKYQKNKKKKGYCYNLEKSGEPINSNCCKFVSIENPLGNLSIPLQCFEKFDNTNQICLPLQNVVETNERCLTDADCGEFSTDTDTKNNICLAPKIPNENLNVMKIHIFKNPLDDLKALEKLSKKKNLLIETSTGYEIENNTKMKKIYNDELEKDNEDSEFVKEKKSREKIVIFLGDAREVWQDVRVGCIIPRFSFFHTDLPYILERFLQ
ncbi:Membrane-bound transcription factor site-2 protease, partial [Clydaea vesicula]